MAENNAVEYDGKYCASMAESAVHYSNKASEWTPNNIKRLIISPDMIVVQLHTHTNLIKKVFQPNKYAQCVMSPKYKNMVSVLGGNGNNVCSHVEEIVYCMKGIQGGVLHSGEANLRAIISSNKAAASEEQLIKVIGDRFKRIYAVVYFNGNINQLMHGVGKRMISEPTYHIADEKSQVLKSVFIHKTDWYRGYFFRPATYPADNENGLLYKKLHKIERDICESESKSKAEDAKNSYIGSLKEKAEKELNSLKLTLRCSQRLAVMLLKSTTKSNLSFEFQSFYSDSLNNLINCSGIVIHDSLELILGKGIQQELSRSGVSVIKPDKGDSKQLADQEVKEIKSASLKIYALLFTLYGKLISGAFTLYPMAIKQYVKNSETKITPVVESFGIDKIGVEYKSSDLKTSVINICSQVSGLLLSDSSCFEYTSREYWSNFANKAVEK